MAGATIYSVAKVKRSLVAKEIKQSVDEYMYVQTSRWKQALLKEIIIFGVVF